MLSSALSLVRDESKGNVSELPAWPLGWYIVARSCDLRPRALRTVKLAERECVLFRTQSGALAALDAHCPHMGAHLKHGKVHGESIECPLHRWRMTGDGKVEGKDHHCAHASSWQVAERFGLIFLHLGGHVRSAAPGPDEANRYAWTSGEPVLIDSDWHSMTVNGFDMLHLQAVHHRELVEPARISVVSEERLTLRYISRVTGHSLSDLVMRWLAKDRIQVRQNCYGPIIVVETDLGFTKTAAVLGLHPEGTQVRAFGAFGILPGRFAGLRLRVTRWLFTAFLRRDFGVIAGMRLRTEGGDEGVHRLAAFLRSLPRLGS